MQKQDLQQLVLGALLHDVGKLSQRAGGKSSREMEGEYCPTFNGRPSHLHVLYTDALISDYNALPLPPEINRDTLARLASSHHKPALDNLEELCLKTADCLSAGADRIEEHPDTGNYKTARMASIFEQVHMHRGSEQEYTKYYPLTAIDHACFPIPLEEARKTTYQKLFDDFLEGLANLPVHLGVDHYTGSLVSILEKYTWCVPSSTYKTAPDISLFDHSMTTASIAQALAVYHDACGGFPGEKKKEKKFVLFGGDLSGIQKYIFGIDKSHGAGVGKILRARSFYLQMLTKSVILSLLKRLNLLPQAKIMDAGGRFVLLLPATSAVMDVLPKFDLEVQTWFLNRFKGELCLNLSYATLLSEDDLRQDAPTTHEDFKASLDRFNDDLDRRKQSKFSLLFAQGFNPVFELNYDAYEHGECVVCKKNPVDPRAADKFEQIHGRRIELCADCAQQIDTIGRKLPKARFLEFSDQRSGGVELFDKIFVRLLDHDPDSPKALEITNIRSRDLHVYHPVAGHLPMISEEDVEKWKEMGVVEESEAGIFIDGEPAEIDDPKTLNLLGLSSMIRDEHGLRGKSFLAAFKADVDNLGFVFGVGLGERLSISRFCTLSRLLNHFFSDYLIRFIEKAYPDIYVVFAGGDDLFVLGPWYQTLHFARDMQRQFREYVCSNPDLTLCAGINISKPRLPVRTIADHAEHLLDEKAKKFVSPNGEEKNAVNVFGVTTQWENFGTLLATGDKLESLVLEGKMSRGLAYRLLTYAAEHRALTRDGDISKGMYKSHMCYDFARNLHVQDQVERDGIVAMIADQFLLDHMHLPLTYALYRIRKD